MPSLRLEHSVAVDSDVYAVVFSPDGKHFAAASNEVVVCDSATGERRTILTGHDVNAVSLVFFGHRNLLSTDFSCIRIWDYSFGTQLKYWKAHHGWVHGAAVVPGKQRVISVGLDKYLRIWSIIDGHEVAAQRLKNTAKCVTVAPNDELAAVGIGASIHLLDTDTFDTLWTSPPSNKRVLSLRFSHNGKFLASAYDHGAVRIWKVTTASLSMVHAIKAHKMMAKGLAFSPKDNLLATSGGHGRVTLWDVNDASEIHSVVVHDGIVNTVDISPNGEHLALGTDANGKMVQLWKISP